MTIRWNILPLPYSLISFIFLSILTGCSGQPPSGTEKDSPHKNSLILIDTFYIEMDRQYKLQKSPELSHDHFDGIILDLLIRGIFDKENQLRDTFIPDQEFIYRHGLNIIAIGNPKNMLYLHNNNTPITFYTFIDSTASQTSHPISIGIVRTAVFEPE